MEINCQHCGKAFTAQRSTARYCSDSCRVQAHRVRKEAEREASRKGPKRIRLALPGHYTGATIELDKAVRRLERLHQDARLPRYRSELATRHASDLQRYAERIAALYEDLTGHPLP